MNKEQAKATIESESLLRQEAKQKIRNDTVPVSDHRFEDEVAKEKYEARPDEIIHGELYAEWGYQSRRHENYFKGPSDIKTEGSLSTKYETSNNTDMLSKTRFANKKPLESLDEDKQKLGKNSKFDAVNKAKEYRNNKIFKAKEDKLSEIVAEKKNIKSKFTDKELRQKAYFVNRLDDANRLVDIREVNTDDAIVYKTFSRRNISDRSRIRHLTESLTSTKYHISGDHDKNDQNTYDNADETAKGVTVTANKFTSVLTTGTKRLSTEFMYRQKTKKQVNAKNIRFLPG